MVSSVSLERLIASRDPALQSYLAEKDIQHQLHASNEGSLSALEQLWRLVCWRRQRANPRQLATEATAMALPPEILGRCFVLDPLSAFAGRDGRLYTVRLLREALRAVDHLNEGNAGWRDGAMSVLGDALLEVEASQRRLTDDGDGGADGGASSEREWVTKVWAFGPREDLAEGLTQLAGAQARQPSCCLHPPLPSAPLSGYFSLTSTRDLLAGDTGCHEWEAGLALAELVLSQPGEIASRSCLELGCGAGAASLAALLCGAKTVVCTDGDALALRNCRRNLAGNGFVVTDLGEALSAGACRLPEGASTWKLDWGCEALPACIAQGPDLLLGADLVYDDDASRSLFRCIKKILKSTPDRRDRALLLATTLRTPDTLPRLEGAAREAGGLSLERMSDWEAGCTSRLWHVPQLEAARPSLAFHRVVHLPPGA